MVKLRYSAGNVISPEVHKIGVLAIGSHLENHGPCLPIDTDAKIASHLALQAALRTGAKFLGVLYAATEYDYVQHGKHISPHELAYKRLLPTLKASKKSMELEKIVLVNGHGGNIPLISYLKDIETETGLEIVFNNKIVEIEGPHAGSGELSIGKILGILDESVLDEQCNFQKYPEVGMVGLNKARKIDEGINKGACLLEKEGISIDIEKGYDMLETAIEDIITDIKNLLK